MKKGVLYLTFNALSEPLGQSQILPYLEKNSAEYDFSVISLEKRKFLTALALSEIRYKCSSSRIKWNYGKFCSRPYIFSTLINISIVLFFSIKLLITDRSISIIHCRSYIPTFIGLLLGRIFNKQVLFDMRGLWVEELVASNSIQRFGLLYKLLIFLEKTALRQSSHIITLTNSSKNFLIENNNIAENKITVIPTCVDLDIFDLTENARREDRLRFVVLGTVLSGWFKFDMLLSFIEAISSAFNSVEFNIITNDNTENIIKRVSEVKSKFSNLELNVYSIQREALAQELQKHDFGVMFYNSLNLCEIARSPTKIGELLACGVPIIINKGIGDVDELIRDKKIGIAIQENFFSSEMSFKHEILKFKQNPEIIERCRETALHMYSVRTGSKLYKNCYKNLISKK